MKDSSIFGKERILLNSLMNKLMKCFRLDQAKLKITLYSSSLLLFRNETKRLLDESQHAVDIAKEMKRSEMIET